MEIYSKLSAANCWCLILMFSPGTWTFAVVGSMSFEAAAALNSAKMGLQLDFQADDSARTATTMTDDLTHKIINWASQMLVARPLCHQGRSGMPI